MCKCMCACERACDRARERKGDSEIGRKERERERAGIHLSLLSVCFVICQSAVSRDCYQIVIRLWLESGWGRDTGQEMDRQAKCLGNGGTERAADMRILSQKQT